MAARAHTFAAGVAALAVAMTAGLLAGRSWGSMYAKRFVSEEAINDKAVGVVGMSGGATLPGGRAFGASDLVLTSNCQDYVS